MLNKDKPLFIIEDDEEDLDDLMEETIKIMASFHMRVIVVGKDHLKETSEIVGVARIDAEKIIDSVLKGEKSSIFSLLIRTRPDVIVLKNLDHLIEMNLPREDMEKISELARNGYDMVVGVMAKDYDKKTSLFEGLYDESFSRITIGADALTGKI